jgi:hypothetical protein
MRRVLLVAWSSLLFAGCTTYSVRRAALVPHMQPIQRSARPMGDTALEVGLGTPVVASITEPSEAEGANAGIVLPRWEVNGALRARVIGGLDIGFLYDHGLNQGARKVNDDMPFPENGDVHGYGFSLYYAAEVDPDFHIGVGADLLLYSIPYVEYQTCVDCAVPYTIADEDRDSIPVVSVGLAGNRRIGPRVSLFGGLNIRNHPTIEKGDIESVDLFDEEVEEGPANFVAMGGVEVDLRGGFRGMVFVHQPLFGDPVNYGPTLGVAVAIPLIGRRAPSAQPAGAPPPAGFPPPPAPPPTY